MVVCFAGLFTVVGHTGFWVSVGFGVITLCVNLFCGFGCLVLFWDLLVLRLGCRI